MTTERVLEPWETLEVPELLDFAESHPNLYMTRLSWLERSEYDPERFYVCAVGEAALMLKARQRSDLGSNLVSLATAITVEDEGSTITALQDDHSAIYGWLQSIGYPRPFLDGMSEGYEKSSYLTLTPEEFLDRAAYILRVVGAGESDDQVRQYARGLQIGSELGNHFTTQYASDLELELEEEAYGVDPDWDDDDDESFDS